jgi:hypothetical protein
MLRSGRGPVKLGSVPQGIGPREGVCHPGVLASSVRNRLISPFLRYVCSKIENGGENHEFILRISLKAGGRPAWSGPAKE